MYFEIVRGVIEEAVRLQAESWQSSSNDMLAKINAHIKTTSREHRKDNPQIQYDDPLCRLGYLYMHGAANATLFEKAIQNSTVLRHKIENASQSVLKICSMGGGPGTELMGLAKYLIKNPNLTPPLKISFTVIDNVYAWADTWTQLAEATEGELRSSLNRNGMGWPVVSDKFLPYDAFDSSSYRLHPVQFRDLDVMVFNYLFSENKTKLDQAREALREIARVAGHGCVFVVIDRLENNPSFTNNVVSIFESAFGMRIEHSTFDGTLDSDEQSLELGEMLIKALGRNPRVKFFTDGYRDPTVFWFAVKRK